MKKLNLLLLTLCLLTSCSRYMYYVYDEDGTREGYPKGYCTFQVNKRKGKAIYRASSVKYIDDPYSPRVNPFVCIIGLSTKQDDWPKKYPIVLKAEYLQVINDFYFGYPFVTKNKQGNIISLYASNNDEIIYFSNETDSLFIYKDKPLHFGDTSNHDLQVSLYSSIQWFPPYVKQAKKIDYDKFMQVKDLGINYKDPMKTKKSFKVIE